MQDREVNRILKANDFDKKNKKEDLCFLLNEEMISDDTDEYIEEVSNYIHTQEDYKRAIEEAKRIKVYKKDRFKLTPSFLFEQIYDYLSDNYGYDAFEWGHLEDRIGTKFFDRICNKFNKEFSYYISDDFVCYLDLSENLKMYCEDYLKDEITGGKQ